LRAHKQHTALHAIVDPEAQVLADDIDRAVRSCLQQASIQSLKSDPNQSAQSLGQQNRRVSFEEWKRRKQAESKLRKQLGEEVKLETQEKQLSKEEEHKAREAYSKQLYEDWLEKKRRDEADKKQREQNDRMQKNEAERIRREEANSKYREWLRDNYIKLQESKRLEYEAKLRNRQKQQEEAVHAANRRRLAEAHFMNWLSRKRNTTPSVQKKSPREEHKSPHLPFLLAYSPNKKRNDTPSDLGYEDYEEADSISQEIRGRRSGDRKHYSEDSQFDEISSIRRNPMLLEQMQSIDDTESIDEEEEDEGEDQEEEGVYEEGDEGDDEEYEEYAEEEYGEEEYGEEEYSDEFMSMSEDY